MEITLTDICRALALACLISTSASTCQHSAASQISLYLGLSPDHLGALDFIAYIIDSARAGYHWTILTGPPTRRQLAWRKISDADSSGAESTPCR
ncbi:hypothetical protein B0H19DRAFT_1114352 [Mycena capillaripes]|nr:hypothetical protein B0H19DRAFT_1114352 [Mycena capillaripes]